MRKASYATLVSAVVLLVVAQCAWSDVIFDTLTGKTVDGDEAVSQSSMITQGFNVGSSNYDLSSVIVSLNQDEPGQAVSGGDVADFTLSIYDASGVDNHNIGYGAPGNLLTTLEGDNDPTASGQFTYTPSSPFQLDANTTYYVVASSTSPNGLYHWDYNNDDSGFPTNVATSGYLLNPSVSGWYMWQQAYPQMMQVNATSLSTPEPGTVGMFCIALGMAGWIRRRRK